jgi:hypothetical protein
LTTRLYEARHLDDVDDVIDANAVLCVGRGEEAELVSGSQHVWGYNTACLRINTKRDRV